VTPQAWESCPQYGPAVPVLEAITPARRGQSRFNPHSPDEAAILSALTTILVKNSGSCGESSGAAMLDLTGEAGCYAVPFAANAVRLQLHALADNPGTCGRWRCRKPRNRSRSQATRHFGCQRVGWERNFVAARLAETENRPQQTENPEMSAYMRKYDIDKTMFWMARWGNGAGGVEFGPRAMRASITPSRPKAVIPRTAVRCESTGGGFSAARPCELSVCQMSPSHHR